jgi:hypothetical protein
MKFGSSLVMTGNFQNHLIREDSGPHTMNDTPLSALFSDESSAKPTNPPSAVSTPSTHGLYAPYLKFDCTTSIESFDQPEPDASSQLSLENSTPFVLAVHDASNTPDTFSFSMSSDELHGIYGAPIDAYEAIIDAGSDLSTYTAYPGCRLVEFSSPETSQLTASSLEQLRPSDISESEGSGWLLNKNQPEVYHPLRCSHMEPIICSQGPNVNELLSALDVILRSMEGVRRTSTCSCVTE